MQAVEETRWNVEDRPCPICGSSEAKKLGARGGRAHRESKGIETAIAQCLNCEIIYTQPTLVPKSNPYARESPEEYFQIHDAKQKILGGESLADFAERIQG